jgi:hypothetical protein
MLQMSNMVNGPLSNLDIAAVDQTAIANRRATESGRASALREIALRTENDER